MVLTLYLLSLIAATFCEEHHIHWSSSNGRWAQNDDPTVKVHIGDKLRLFCPDPSADEKYLKVYQVGEMGYENCMLDYVKTLVLVCEPFKSPSTVVNIRTATGLPNGLTFQPDTTYYWISTSDGNREGIDKQSFGLCRSSNFRLKIDVSNSNATETGPDGRRASRITKMHIPPPPVITPNIPQEFLPNVELTDSQLQAAEGVVDPVHLKQVLALSRSGMTGKYVREQPNETPDFSNQPKTNEIIKGEQLREPQPWDPAPADVYKGIYNDDEISSPDIVFEVHEPGVYSRSDSLASSFSRSWSLLLLIISILPMLV